jgi:hypothetical protein
MNWITLNRTWLFSGAGIATLSALWWILNRFLYPRPDTNEVTQSTTITVSPTFNNSVVLPPSSSPLLEERYEEWQKLDRALRACIREMEAAFVPFNSYRPGDPRNDPRAATHRGEDVLHGSILITDSLTKNGLFDSWAALVKYVQTRYEPPAPGQPRMTATRFSEISSEFLATLKNAALEDLDVSPTEDVSPTTSINESTHSKAEHSENVGYKWTRGDVFALLGLIIGLLTVVTPFFIPEIRVILRLDKSPTNLPFVPSASIGLGANPETKPLVGQFAKTYQELRENNKVTRIAVSESEKSLAEIPRNSFGDAAPVWFVDFSSEKMRVVPRGVVSDFEVQKLADGSVMVVGYVGLETAEGLREGLHTGEALTLYSISLKDYSTLVAVPLDRLKCTRDRENILGRVHGLYNAVDMLDCAVQ